MPCFSFQRHVESGRLLATGVLYVERDEATTQLGREVVVAIVPQDDGAAPLHGFFSVAARRRRLGYQLRARNAVCWIRADGRPDGRRHGDDAGGGARAVPVPRVARHPNSGVRRSQRGWTSSEQLGPPGRWCPRAERSSR